MQCTADVCISVVGGYFCSEMLLKTGLEATWLATQCSTEANLVIHSTLCTCSVGGLPCCGSCVRPTSMCSGLGFALTSVFKLERL